MKRALLWIGITLYLTWLLWWSGLWECWNPALQRMRGFCKTPSVNSERNFSVVPSVTASRAHPDQTQKQAVDVLLAFLQKSLEKNGALPNQAILRFKTPEAMRKFLQQMGGYNLKLLGRIDDMLALKVGYDRLEQLRDAMMNNPNAFDSIASNYLVKIPDFLQERDRPPGISDVGYDGLGYLSAIGASGDRSTWGQGVTVAVVDTGVSAYPEFRPGQITHMDLAPDGQPFNGHGTAMANLIAGLNPDAPGIAPGTARIIDVKVTDSQGVGDAFTLAQGIQAAVNAGAQVINISLGTYGDSELVRTAIENAFNNGVVVVAAAGNDALNQLTFPAAIPSVISVGAVDANGNPTSFTNLDQALVILAPGVDIQSAYTIKDIAYVVWGDGTSQAAAITSGVIDYLVSKGLTPAEADNVIKTSAVPSKDGHYRILRLPK